MNRLQIAGGVFAALTAVAPSPGSSGLHQAAVPGEFAFAPYVHFLPTYNTCGGESHCDVTYGFAAVWVGDMTGDGRDDVVTSPFENEIWIIPQRADGSLELEAPHKHVYGDPGSTRTKHFAMGDFNEDGAQDLVGNVPVINSMFVLLSDGTGGHVLDERPEPVPLEDDWQHPVADDVDGDGHLDVVYFAHGFQSPLGETHAIVQYGDGTGGFPRHSSTLVGTHGYVRVEMADFNGDGRPDIAGEAFEESGDSTLAISYHDGHSGFLPPQLTDIPFQTASTFGDFDGDGRAEITLHDGRDLLAVPVMDPSASVVIGPAEFFNPHVALATDLDRDGRTDLYTTQFVCPYFCTWIYLAPYLNLASGWRPIPTPPGEDPHIPQNVTQHPRAFASGDINGDGCTDMVTAHNQDGLAFLHGTGCVVPQTTRGDFDGDGRSDVFWRNERTGRNAIWLHADYSNQRAARRVDASGWTVAGMGDFDGDGTADLFWRNTSTGANVAWRGGDYGDGLDITDVANAAWGVATIGDFDGDGREDLMWRNWETGANVIWAGADYRSQVGLPAVSLGWQVAGAADFDGDLRTDVLWHSPSTGRSVIWRHGDYGDQQSVRNANDGWSIAGVGDFDGDGVADILWRNAQTGANVAWRRGDAGDVLQVTDVTSLDWGVAAVGDYDGDGSDDLLWRNTRTGANVIWRAADYRAQTRVTAVSNLDWQVVSE